jgi:hypothetical protein
LEKSIAAAEKIDIGGKGGGKQHPIAATGSLHCILVTSDAMIRDTRRMLPPRLAKMTFCPTRALKAAYLQSIKNSRSSEHEHDQKVGYSMG